MPNQNFGQQYLGENMVFIVGSPRSGTTWLQRLLASHPKIHTGQESDLFDVYIGPQMRAWYRDLDIKPDGRGILGLACYFREEEFISILKEYTLSLLQPMLDDLQDGDIFIEKTPSHALFIPEIVKLLPKSRILHILRDGRDVVASMLAAARSWGVHWAPRSVRKASRMWVNHVQAIIEAEPLVPPEQFMELKYEDLHASSLKTLEEVFQFLGMAWDESEMKQAIELNKPEVARTGGGTIIPMGGEGAKLLGSEVKEPIGFVRKARPGPWKTDLSLLEKSQVWFITHQTMQKVGYNWVTPW